MLNVKHYILWFSGAVIEGNVDDKTADFLQSHYGKRKKYKFTDEDGIASIQLRHVLACSINEIDRMKKVKGFCDEH